MLETWPAKPKEDKQPLPGPAEIIFDKNGNIIPDKDGEYPAATRSQEPLPCVFQL